MNESMPGTVGDEVSVRFYSKEGQRLTSSRVSFVFASSESKAKSKSERGCSRWLWS